MTFETSADTFIDQVSQECANYGVALVRFRERMIFPRNSTAGKFRWSNVLTTIAERTTLPTIRRGFHTYLLFICIHKKIN